jgi:hypothetical protein
MVRWAGTDENGLICLDVFYRNVCYKFVFAETKINVQ